MKAYLKLKFNKPLDADKHCIAPGGYEVVAGGKTYLFDFEESEGKISEEDNTVAEFYFRNEDYDTFPEVTELKKHLSEITELSECYVWTSEQGEGDEELSSPVLESILEFRIQSADKAVTNVPKSTAFVSCREVDKEDVTSADIVPTVEYSFSRRLLDECLKNTRKPLSARLPEILTSELSGEEKEL